MVEVIVTVIVVLVVLGGIGIGYWVEKREKAKKSGGGSSQTDGRDIDHK